MSLEFVSPLVDQATSEGRVLARFFYMRDNEVLGTIAAYMDHQPPLVEVCFIPPSPNIYKEKCNFAEALLNTHRVFTAEKTVRLAIAARPKTKKQ